MSSVKSRLNNLVNSPMFIALSIAVLFGNFVGYLATRHPEPNCTTLTSEARPLREEADVSRSWVAVKEPGVVVGRGK